MVSKGSHTRLVRAVLSDPREDLGFEFAKILGEERLCFLDMITYEGYIGSINITSRAGRISRSILLRL